MTRQSRWMPVIAVLLFVEILLGFQVSLHAQERPYFVTYSQDMEEPGNLDIESYNVVGNPKGGEPSWAQTRTGIRNQDLVDD